METPKSILTITAIALLIAAGSVRADSFNLTSDHCSGGCGPAGTVFGTVTLTQNGTTVDFTVHLNSPYEFAKTQAADDMAFKFNAVGIVLADITVNQTVPGQTLAPMGPGAFNGDGTGNFAWGIECTTCGMGLSSGFSNDIVFHVANSTLADFENPNSIGTFFVADVGNPGTGATGPIDAGPSVPDGGTTLMLLASALSGLGLVRRFFWR